MTVIAEEVPRGEFLFYRDSDEKRFVRWTENLLDGEGYKGKNLRRWSANFEMFAFDELVYRKSCICDEYGYVTVHIPANAFSDSDWDWKLIGTWRFIAYGPNGEQVVLAEGGYEIA